MAALVYNSIKECDLWQTHATHDRNNITTISITAAETEKCLNRGKYKHLRKSSPTMNKQPGILKHYSILRSVPARCIRITVGKFPQLTSGTDSGKERAQE